MYTEDEAKTKWCPYVNAENSPKKPEFFTCVASDCMMWKWDTNMKCSKYEKGSGEFCKCGWLKDLHPAQGYCGLTK
jgi:hypothetical protein